jgi:hypothetical protein
VPQDFNQDSSVKNTPAGGESPKVDKPPNLQVKRTAPDFLKPSNPKGAQGSPGASDALTSPTRGAPDQDPADASLVPGPNKCPRTSPPSPQSHGLRATGGSQHGEGSSEPRPEKVPRQHSRVAESLWDNSEFI